MRYHKIVALVSNFFDQKPVEYSTQYSFIEIKQQTNYFLNHISFRYALGDFAKPVKVQIVQSEDKDSFEIQFEGLRKEGKLYLETFARKINSTEGWSEDGPTITFESDIAQLFLKSFMEECGEHHATFAPSLREDPYGTILSVLDSLPNEPPICTEKECTHFNAALTNNLDSTDTVEHVLNVKHKFTPRICKHNQDCHSYQRFIKNPKPENKDRVHVMYYFHPATPPLQQQLPTNLRALGIKEIFQKDTGNIFAVHENGKKYKMNLELNDFPDYYLILHWVDNHGKTQEITCEASRNETFISKKEYIWIPPSHSMQKHLQNIQSHLKNRFLGYKYICVAYEYPHDGEDYSDPGGIRVFLDDANDFRVVNYNNQIPIAPAFIEEKLREHLKDKIEKLTPLITEYLSLYKDVPVIKYKNSSHEYPGAGPLYIKIQQMCMAKGIMLTKSDIKIYNNNIEGENLLSSRIFVNISTRSFFFNTLGYKDFWCLYFITQMKSNTPNSEFIYHLANGIIKQMLRDVSYGYTNLVTHMDCNLESTSPPSLENLERLLSSRPKYTITTLP
ncbi:MAG: hypothetical protein HRT90_03240 [Candidatus Margulisbacteria bacterium]|nr:hypothetical protein [Candidatus Margulisiibacteriota bacterium]